MYEVMVAWETINLADQPPFLRDFAEIWQAADKIVYSKTLEAASSAGRRPTCVLAVYSLSRRAGPRR